MIAVPLRLAVPAAAASLAYLNARWSFSNDWALLSGLATGRLSLALLERRDRVNLFYVLEQYAHHKKVAARECVVFQGHSWTFKETYDIVLQYASWLKQVHGVKPKDIIAMCFMNSPEFIFLWMALWSLGSTPAFINYNLAGKPLTHSIRVSTARLVIIDPQVRSQFTPELFSELSSSSSSNPLQCVYLDEAERSDIVSRQPHRADDSDRSGAKGSSIACLIYTSGTTGLPKPAVVSWSKSRVGGVFVAKWSGLRPGTDRFYTCMPLYHSSASILGYCTCVMSGTTFIIGQRFSTKLFWEEVRASRATVIQYVGETLRYLLATPPKIDPATGQNLDQHHEVRMAFGNGLRPDVWEKFKKRFGVETIAEFYAATEGSSASFNLSSNSFGTGAVGRNGALAEFVLGFMLTVVEVDPITEEPWRDPGTGFCKVVPRGTPGELLYRLDAENVAEQFQGYLNNEKATQSKIMRDVLQQGDAWYRTGDLMRWDKEGRWFFSDRIGDTFRWKSENVSTAEVSEVIGHHPSILEANVYGVQLPNHDGRAGCAAIVFDSKAGSPSPKQDVLDSIARFAANGLPKYAVPLFLRTVRKMQATGNNKQQKHEFRTQGVNPANLPAEEQLYWLQGGTYVPFKEQEWERLAGGQMRL
ncbi:MAG: hypothetical protein Q9160_005251 [Pyrenula sp. 1 TL-2023]